MSTENPTIAPTSHNMPKPGETFARFEVLELLGRGGMGQIFRVCPQDKPDAEALALKVVDSPNLSRVDRLRFEREFQLTSQFHHPNLVEVYEFGSYQGTTYYTMEWVKGIDIDSAFERERQAMGGGELPPAAIGWIDGLLSGLQTLHEAGIVHRDLKPENILVDNHGQPKLLDLGLASHFNDQSSVSRLTVPGAVLGTIHFMAPEQVIGAEVGPRVDLYALGVLLFRWFTDRLPFIGPDPISVLGQILHEAPPRLEPVLQLPKGAVELVEQLLRKDPDDRPASAAQVRAAWSRAFGSLSDSAERELVAPSLKALPLPPRFVGREKELERAQCRLLEGSAQGLSVIFTGAAGMGRSRALAELRDWAKRRRWKVLQTAASPLDTLPFQPLLDPLRASLRYGIPPSLESFRPELSLILPELMSDGAEQDTELNPMRRYRLFEGMRRVLMYDRRRTDEAVTLMTLEDLQHAGDETLEFLHFLKQRQEVDGRATLLVAASLASGGDKPEAAATRLEQTLSSHELLSIELGPLDNEAARRLILSMVGGGALEEVSLRAFLGQSEGNPLFLIEMTRAFLEEGRLQRQRRGQEDVWKLRLPSLSEASTSSAKIPDSLKSVVTRRLRPLEREDRELLKKAAFLGLRFSFTLLAALAKMPEAEVFDRLVSMAARGLVKEGKGSDTFDFCNSIIPAVLLDSASPSEKRFTHLQICHQALAQNPEDCDPFWLAWHYREAGDEGEAIRHLEKSADRALASFSFTQAAALYREILSSGTDLAALGLKRPELEEKSADALRFRGDLAQAGTVYGDLLARTAGPGGALRLRLLRKLALVKDGLGESAACFRLLKTAWKEMGLTPLDTVSGPPNLLSLLKALTSSRLSLSSRSKMARLSPEETEEMMAVAAELQRLLFFLRPQGWVQQAVEVALSQRRAKRSKAEDSLDAAQADFNGAYLCLRLPKGWQPQTLRYLDSATAKMAQAPSSFRHIELQRDVGYLYHLAGRPERGLELLKDAAEQAERVGHLTTLPGAYGLAAAAAISMAEFEDALSMAWKGYHLAQATENRRDIVLTTCELARAMIYLKLWDQALPMLDSLSQADFELFPYLRTVWIQIAVEKEIWYGQPGGFERAEALALEGINVCADLDELRYHRASLHILLIEARLKRLWLEAMSEEDWSHSERRLKPFSHLRFRLKLMKMMWLLKAGQLDEGRLLAQRLLERPECNSYRGDLIKKLLSER
jgi:serine/threonine-protein kinase